MVMGELSQETEVLVIGGGPGGYAAAFRAADLGLEVAMVDQSPRPGGECLFRGCIPSKTLLHLAELIDDAKLAESMGLTFGPPRIKLDEIRAWKDKVIDKLADGLVTLAQKRGVQLIQGRAVFEEPGAARIYEADISHIKFRHAILASGSFPTEVPGLKATPDGRVMDSTGALDLADLPERLLIVGGGYIALELGSVYAAFGSRVSVAVRSDRLLRGADEDLAAPLLKRLGEAFENIWINTKIKEAEEKENAVRVVFDGEPDPAEQEFGRVLVAAGRRPRTDGLGLDKIGVALDKRGFVKVDDRQRTSVDHIYAIGDVAGEPMLAHKAFREGKVAAEVIAGEPSAFDVRAIPAVVYTDPQIAWCGLTEEEAKEKKIPVRVERFPWKFSSRATTMDASAGLTKILIEPDTGRIVGLGVVGRGAEGLIAEGVLAVEMGALAQDVALSIHAHPTLSETVGEASEIFLGSVTHILPRKKS